MLRMEDKFKTEQYIAKVVSELRQTIQAFSDTNMPVKVVIEKAVVCTVNRFTPESKMILSNVYNMLQTQTMTASEFQNVEKKDAFYKLHLLETLNAKFNFDIPSDIDYSEGAEIVKKALLFGSMTSEGLGILFSIAKHSFAPVCIGTILAGIMFFARKKKPVASGNVMQSVDKYLADVKEALLQWVTDIERFYDEQVATIQ